MADRITSPFGARSTARVGELYLEDCAQAPSWSQENPMAGVMPYAAEQLWALSEDTVGARQ